VVFPISTILRGVILNMVDLGVAYVFPRVLRKKLHNCCGFLLQLLGHPQFSSVVTQSQFNSVVAQSWTGFGWHRL